MPWDSILPYCFGRNYHFAIDAAHKDKAFEWLQSLRQRGIGWQEAEAQISAYLNSETLSKGYIGSEIAHARIMIEPWLNKRE